MKLLIITQKMDENDPILGFFHRWVEEFAKHCKQVTVICLEKGTYHLPSNVGVLSLGKEEGASRLKYLVRFYRYIWRERKNYDAVFVHMNPIYVVLGGVLWKIWKKKISLWYTHKSVDLKLRIAEKLADVVFTASKESFRLKSKKVKIMGHGIDVERFMACRHSIGSRSRIEILHVGRITPIKGLETLIEAARILKEQWKKQFHVTLVGAPVSDGDARYRKKIEILVKKYRLEDYVTFVGSIPNKEIIAYYSNADVVVNLTPTGGLDKVVLEAMAAGVPVFSSNKAFYDYFGEFDSLLLCEREPEDLANKIMFLFNGEDVPVITKCLVASVKKRANVSFLIEGIVGGVK